MNYQGYSQTATEAKGAGVGRRFLAIFIDGIIVGIIFGIINVILGSNTLELKSGIGAIIYRKGPESHLFSNGG